MDEREIIYLTANQIHSVEMLEKIADRLGNPTDCSTEAGWKLIEAMIDFWEANFPDEVKDWKHDRDIDLAHEKNIKQLVKTGLINSVTYPPRLYTLIRLMLPEQSVTDKNFISKLGNRFNLFKTTNHKI